jgi:hypothetical protein
MNRRARISRIVGLVCGIAALALLLFAPWIEQWGYRTVAAHMVNWALFVGMNAIGAAMAFMWFDRHGGQS